MIKTISYWSMPGGLENTLPIDSALQQAKAAGFQGLELAIGPEGVIHTGLTEADCKPIRAQIQASGLVVQTLASGMSWGFNPVSNDPAVRAKAFELNAQALRIAGWLGLEAVLFVPGVVTSPISPSEKVRYDHAIERAEEVIGRLAKVAEEVGVDLCIENVWNGLFYSPLEFAAFVEKIASPRVGIYFDCGNVLGYHQYPPHWIELLGKHIKRVHIKDYKLGFDWNGTFSFCKLLEGDVPWAETVAALRAIGYQKTVVAEMLPPSEGLLEQTSAAMDKIFAL